MNDQSNTPPNPPAFNVEKRVEMIRKFEAKVKKMKADFIEATKPFNEAADTLRNEVLGWMQANNIKNLRTDAGTPYEYKDTSWRIEDIDTFKRHVIGSEDWDLMTWHVSKVVCDARFEADQSIAPGVVRDARVKLGIKAPVKARTRKPAQGSQQAGLSRPLTDEEWAQIEREVDQELEADNFQE